VRSIEVTFRTGAGLFEALCAEQVGRVRRRQDVHKKIREKGNRYFRRFMK
jgi:hypothetical protein